MPRRDPQLPAALLALEAVARRQGDVVTTAQVRSAGVSRAVERRLVGNGVWTALHRGVLLTSPGEPDPEARMWAAHLVAGPDSVIAGPAAGFAQGLLQAAPGPTEPITLMVPDPCGHTVGGIVLRHVHDLDRRRHPARTPPVLTVEFAVLDLVRTAPSDALAIATIERACRLRLTTPERLLAAAAQVHRVRRRVVVKEVCAEVREGITSALERRFHRDVELPHRLPRPERQVVARPAGGRTAYRDLRYPGGVLVELDGRLGHEEESDVFRDHRRDNAATLTGDATLRFGWLGVSGEPCESAAQVVRLLRMRGTHGAARGCRPGCPVSAALRDAPNGQFVSEWRLEAPLAHEFVWGWGAG